MARIDNRNKQNPKLLQAELSDGRASLYLEYYLGRSETPVLDEDGQQVLYTEGATKGRPKFKVKHARKRENLNLYIWVHPRSTQERLQNKNTLALAEKIRFEREQEFLMHREGYRLKKDRSVNFLDYFQKYLDNYTKADVASMKTALTKFKRFLEASSKYDIFRQFIRADQITKSMMTDFAEYLQANGRGEGPAATFHRFKKVLRVAMEDELIRKNPCDGIILIRGENVLKKEILLPDEINTLLSTPCNCKYPDIQRAFALSLFTGIRFCDVRRLRYRDIDYTAQTLKFQQSKTRDRSNHSWVLMPLNDHLLTLIGQPSDDTNPDALLFDLPSYASCHDVILRWVEKAGIKKHISWHCARHSFAVNVLNGGANIKTLASLLGHSGIKHTEKYTRAIDSLRQDAINSLGNIIIPQTTPTHAVK